MSNSIFQITIAIDNVQECLDFYSNVFDIKFEEYDLGNDFIYGSAIGDINIILCPKNVAGITANENNIQLSFFVENVEKSYEAAGSSSGSVIEEITTASNIKSCSLRDPDGNSLIIAQELTV